MAGIEALMIGVNLLVTFLLAQRIYSPLGSLYRKLEHKDAEEHINEIEAFDQAFETYEKEPRRWRNTAAVPPGFSVTAG